MVLEHPAVTMFQEAVDDDNYSDAIRAVEYAKREGVDTARMALEKMPVWTDPLEVAKSEEMLDLINQLRSEPMHDAAAVV
jgi:hypothetical protein